MVHSLANKIRAKKLGVLLRDARQVIGKDLQDCAEAIGVQPQAYQAYEMGDMSPSLPELEALAYYLDIPLEHFWGQSLLSQGEEERQIPNLEEIKALRQRIIGATLRKAREENELSAEDVSQEVGIPEQTLVSYELGEQSIPLPELEALTDVLNLSIQDLQDQNSPAGEWSKKRKNVETFLELPDDIQSFVSKPVNGPYLELAQRLSEMSVEKLRAVAEGLLEITL
jgi:transcriptional regulator with XRE-family HTH domain